MTIINFKQSFRNLSRNKIYSLVNLAGLGVSGAFILLVMVYVHHALQLDKFSGTENVYRIEANNLWEKPDTLGQSGVFDWLVQENQTERQLVTPLVLAEDVARNFPEVKELCRLQTVPDAEVIVGTKRFKEQGHRVAFADKNFFSFFNLPLLDATQENAFPDIHSVVISEGLAKKYFGTSEAVGKTVALKDEEQNLFTVSAVAKSFPANSSMQFDLVFCLQGLSDYTERMAQGTNQSSTLTLLKLAEGVSPVSFKGKLAAFGETYFKDLVALGKQINPDAKELAMGLSIRPFSAGHYNVSSPWFAYTDAKSLYQLIVLAFIALGIACLNYILLSLSRVAIRSHEAGVRKTVGAGWHHIVLLFLTETLVMVFFSLVVGFLLALLALPYFSALTGVPFTLSEMLQPSFLGAASLLAFTLTLVAGIYPALKMAGIKPLNVLSRFGTYKLNPSLSKVVIGIQYTACIVLVVLAIVVARQLQFVGEKELGFDKEQTLIVQNPYWPDRTKTRALQENLRAFTAGEPGLIGFTGSSTRFGDGGNRNGHNINGTKFMLQDIAVDYDYFELNRILLLKGRSFSRQFASDTATLEIPKEKLDSLSSRTRSNLVVNETLYTLLGQPPLNEPNKELGGVIVGVCQDYFNRGLQEKIGPVYHRCRPGRVSHFWFKMAGGQPLPALIAKVKARMLALAPAEEFSYSFLDDDVKKVYESHERWLKVIALATWMTIFIACLGLFGLSAIVAVNRTKEIGIRKVLGASLGQLFFTLNRQSLLIVLLAIVAAVPIAALVADSWLQNFAYRIRLHWLFFVLAAFIGLACALAAVSYHTLKAARANPVKSLRTE